LDLRLSWEASDSVRLSLGSRLSFDGYRKVSAQPSTASSADEADIVRWEIGPSIDWLLGRGLRLRLGTAVVGQEYHFRASGDGPSTLSLREGLQFGLGLSYAVSE
jgi:hypothetical protein